MMTLYILRNRHLGLTRCSLDTRKVVSRYQVTIYPGYGSDKGKENPFLCREVCLVNGKVASKQGCCFTGSNLIT